MLKKGICRKKVLMLSICLTFVGVLIFLVKNNRAFASNVGYYSTYKDIADIENSDYFTSTQGMSIYDGKAYYARTVNTKNYKSAYTQIWTLDMESGSKQLVYNTDEDKDVFNVGHANSLFVDEKYMYIATQLNNEPSIYRYNIWWEGDICYMGELKKYNVYSSNSEDRILTSITGIEYAEELGGFLLKNGMTVYLGNFEEDEFIWNKSFKLDTQIMAFTNDGTEYIDVADGKYIMQGMFYKKGYIYMPMTNASRMGQSIVVPYPIDNSVESGNIISPTTSYFIRITSSKYERLFEIEEVACYNGEMYASINAIGENGIGKDRIIKINDFKMEE